MMNDTDQPDFVTGDFSGLEIPAHPDAFIKAGPAFLTTAMRSFGAITPDNAISAMTNIQPCPSGSTGAKLLFDVEYTSPQTQLPHRLFAKFSRDYTDPVRDNRGKHEMAGEARFARASRNPAFPVPVPHALFADYHQESCTGLVITERIGFGTPPVEPQHHKCMDHLLSDPAEYYHVIIESLAKIAASHRSGRLGTDIDTIFPYDPAISARETGLVIPGDEHTLLAKVRALEAFISQYPQLFPNKLAAENGFRALAKGAPQFFRHQQEIARFLTEDLSHVALCHWNANIDNCWFWREDNSALHCGLMDWGHAGQLNLAFSLWGCMAAALPSLWDTHFDKLITLFVSTLEKNGFPRPDKAALLRHLDLYVAMMGFNYFIDCPPRIKAQTPDLDQVSSNLDPQILAVSHARNNLTCTANVLGYWHRRDPLASLRAIISS